MSDQEEGSHSDEDRFYGGDPEATRKLYMLCCQGIGILEVTTCEVKRLLDMRANPYWHSRDGGIRHEKSALCDAIQFERLDLLRLFYAAWPDVDRQREDHHYTNLEFAVDQGYVAVAECLLELGAPFMHMEAAPESENNVLMTMLITRFKMRANNCGSSVAALLSRRFRMRYDVPRDVAKLIGREVWRTRRSDTWESPESLQQWQKRYKEYEEFRDDIDDE